MSQMRIGPLVRATTATCVTIWAEFTQPCTMQLSVIPTQSPQADPISLSVRTTTVGGRHYATPQLNQLQPATWYTYHIHTTSPDIPTRQKTASSLLQCFRTLDQPPTAQTASPAVHPPLRLVYGSCRKPDQPATDALSAFATWLQHHFEQRETTWPHLLLLIGDQIYADQPTRPFIQQYPHLRHGATQFADFALFYEYAWTHDDAVRQVLATIPSYMIFDDHEILNNWNISPQWYAQTIKRGHEQKLIDGLVAYWIYQGWGNLTHQQNPHHPLLNIMQQAEASGEDALAALRTAIKQDMYDPTRLTWHYTIPTNPPIFVANVRAHRTTVFTNNPQAIYAPARIMDQQQMNELQTWMHQHDNAPSLLVSSVPVLLPPCIGLAEYLLGLRLWPHSSAPLCWLGQQLARLQLKLAVKTGFDHWPIFSTTWQELLHLLDTRQHDILLLSGDVHFSYAARAQRTHSQTPANFYQFVSTPIQNTLTRRDYLLILTQALLKTLIYSNLTTHILPLRPTHQLKEIHRHLLFRNTLAYLHLQPQGATQYQIHHGYLGIINKQMQIIASTQLD
jgi:PhoD-like phosphatase